MTMNATEMLRMLGSGVRPAGASSTTATQPIEGQSFADLLKQVKSGGVSSGQPLSVKAGVEAGLSETQMSRLSKAADSAEASGAHRVMAVVDDRAVTIDVASRTIESVTSWSSGLMMTDIDAVMMVPAEGAAPGGLLGAVTDVATGAGDLLAGLAKFPGRAMTNLFTNLRGGEDEKTAAQ